MADRNVDLNIEGMTCDHCVGAITRALKALPGVQTANVSLSEKRANVTFDESEVSVAAMRQVIEEEGYQASEA